MASRIVVLGAGLVGGAIAADLKGNGHEVFSVDLNPETLKTLFQKYGINTIQADFNNPETLKEIVSDADLVIGAAPGSVGYELMKQVILNRKNMVDISFCPEDFLDLNDLAVANKVTVVADMGVAPGMCNAILGYHNSVMNVHSYKCIVGGLPVKREWPLEYKSSWSPMDCIEEYIRPARIMRGGKVVILPALSDIAEVEIEGIGTLEEWNSDGLRSLLKTMTHIPDMVEKTLRYPGTTKYVRALRELGFFSVDELNVNGKMIRPLDLTTKLLFPKWKLDEGEEEFTVMQVDISGTRDGVRKSYRYELIDRYDQETGMLSMARTTGFTCTGTVDMILKGMITQTGVLAPEQVGAIPDNLDYLLQYLTKRRVISKVKTW